MIAVPGVNDTRNAMTAVKVARAVMANGRGKDPGAFGLTSYLTSNFWFGGREDGITIHTYGFASAAGPRSSAV